jgi:hypothetical protein
MYKVGPRVQTCTTGDLTLSPFISGTMVAVLGVKGSLAMLGASALDTCARLHIWPYIKGKGRSENP